MEVKWSATEAVNHKCIIQGTRGAGDIQLYHGSQYGCTQYNVPTVQCTYLSTIVLRCKWEYHILELTVTNMLCYNVG